MTSTTEQSLFPLSSVFASGLEYKEPAAVIQQPAWMNVPREIAQAANSPAFLCPFEVR